MSTLADLARDRKVAELVAVLLDAGAFEPTDTELEIAALIVTVQRRARGCMERCHPPSAETSALIRAALAARRN